MKKQKVYYVPCYNKKIHKALGYMVWLFTDEKMAKRFYNGSRYSIRPVIIKEVKK